MSPKKVIFKNNLDSTVSENLKTTTIGEPRKI